MTDMTRDEALRLRIIEAAVEWAGQKAGEPFEGDERKALELTAAKALTLMERETEALSRPAPAPRSAEVEALCERLDKRKQFRLPRDWQDGRKCPECGSPAKRPKCLFDMGGYCPRHDPDNYDPDPRVEEADPDCAEAADLIRTLAARVEELEKWLEERDQ